ncbi:MAG: hypothetical protein ACKV0T_28260 [Planctomycetales bacterium]
MTAPHASQTGCSLRQALVVGLCAAIGFFSQVLTGWGEEVPRPPKAAEPVAAPAAKARPAAWKRNVVRKLEITLKSKSSFKAEKVPLEKLLASLADSHDIAIKLDKPVLEKAGIRADVPVSVAAKNETLESILQSLLKDLGLRHRIDGEELVVTTLEAADAADAAAKERQAADLQPAARQDAEAPAAVAAEAAVEAAGAIVVQFNAQGAQFEQQFRPLLEAELHLIRKVCQPTPEQKTTLKKEGEAAFKDAIGQYTAAQQKMMQGGWRGDQAFPNPKRLLQAALIAAVKKHLTDEQVAVYDKEIEQRTSNYRRVAVQSLVSLLDQDLVLSSDQREKISAALYDNWNDAWCQSLEVFMYGADYLPNLPDQHVAVFLNPVQKDIWRGAQRNGGMTIFGGGFMQGMAVGEIVWDDEPVQGVEIEVQPVNELQPEDE